MIRFGPGGNSERFYNEGYKSSVDMPQWLAKAGLSAYEYQCNKGVHIGEKTARELGEKAKQSDILISIHAPYFINLASVEEKIQENSIRHLTDSLTVGKYLGAKRIVFHPGSPLKEARDEAFERVKVLLKKAIQVADSLNLFQNIYLCPEVMGKINQIGSLEEIAELCTIDERLLPAVDFGHLHARKLGGMNTEEDFLKALNYLENRIGLSKVQNMHIHFSTIEFTKGGEKRHHNFEDPGYGPDFTLLASALVKKKAEPVIICESTDNMVEDALTMKKIYEDALSKM